MTGGSVKPPAKPDDPSGIEHEILARRPPVSDDRVQCAQLVRLRQYTEVRVGAPELAALGFVEVPGFVVRLVVG